MIIAIRMKLPFIRTNIVNNQKTEQHLCGTCARSYNKREIIPYSSFMNDMWMLVFTNDFFKNMVYPDNLLKSSSI